MEGWAVAERLRDLQATMSLTGSFPVLEGMNALIVRHAVHNQVRDEVGFVWMNAVRRT